MTVRNLYMCIGTEVAMTSAILYDVTHFLPYSLDHVMSNISFDGIWDLVLVYPDRSRCKDGKFFCIL